MRWFLQNEKGNYVLTTLQNKDQTQERATIKYNSENWMCCLAQQKLTKANSLNLYPKTNVYFRETCKSQRINLISPTTKFNLGTIQIKIISLSTLLVLSSIKIYLSVLSISDLLIWPKVRGLCKVRVCFYVCLYFFPFNLKCSKTTVRKNWTFDLTPRVECVFKDKIYACMVLCTLFSLIWYAKWHDTFRFFLSFDPTLGTEDVC